MMNLPKELVEEILCRVPSKSLERLRSTCKRWNRLFSNSRFVRKHLDKVPKELMVLIPAKVFKSYSVNLHEGPIFLFQSQLNFDHALMNVSLVFHCDGLLLFTIQDNPKIVVWNPCTGQTRWINARITPSFGDIHVFGSYRDSKSGRVGYKILSYWAYNVEKDKFAIFEMNSNSWRNIDVVEDFTLMYLSSCVSLKGQTYWFALDDKTENKPNITLVGFDYTTERFIRMPLPSQFRSGHCYSMVLSCVREEKLSVLLQRTVTSSKEIWVTNKIDDETKVVTWSKVLEVVGEDNKTRRVDLTAALKGSCWPGVLYYVPSLVQIPLGIAKRKFDVCEPPGSNKIKRVD